MVARYKIVCIILLACHPRLAWSAPEEIAPPIDVGPGATPDAAPQPGAPAAPATGPVDPPQGADAVLGHVDDGNAKEVPWVAPAAPELALPGREAQHDDISLEDWSRDDWTLVRPRVALLDMSGYLRLRGDMLRRLDFGNASVWEFADDGTQATGVPRYRTLSDNQAEYTQTSMRLRVEPRINVAEQIQIVSTIDVFDNLILGSTPNTLAPAAEMSRTPVNVLSTSQTSVRRGINSVSDSITVKRLWGRVTALNEQLELKFGRMPDHFGLGMWYNDGDCLDCDYGTVTDRLMVSFRALGHVFSPMVDWVSKGPSTQPFGPYDPKPVDALSWDDAMEYGLRIVHEDHPDDIQDAVLHHRAILNYGLSNLVRLQNRDLNLSYYNGQRPYLPINDPNINGPTAEAVQRGERRDAVIYAGDLYAKYYRDNYEVAAEAGTQVGSFKDQLPAKQGSSILQTTRVFTLGVAAEGRYFLRQDRRGTRLGFKLGGASGDSRPGIGALDRADTQRGATAGGYDLALRNFQFSPDYHIDLLLFRRMLGTVTDAMYLRPEVAYRFDDKFQARVAAIYSQAMMARSTPSASNGASGHRPLGLELDGEVTYGADPKIERGQFMASLAGGLLFPLSGFGNPTATADAAGGKFAWTVQGRVYLTF